jgi:carbamate kinase
VRRTATALADVLQSGDVVVTHGNGPQVGNELLRQERAAAEAPPLPLYLAVAQTQAEIGALLAGELSTAGRRRFAVLVTHVVVDPRDPAFRAPSKPVGPFYRASRARALERERGWTLVSDAGRGWRRVVPSPEPLAVVELAAVRTLLAAGTPVVACGGGGIPVVSHNGRLSGVEAVVDKDRASALLAGELGARRLLVLTDVPAVQLGFGTRAAENVHELAPEEATTLAENLAAGSMRPKLEACAAFVAAGGGEAIITSADTLADALAGQAGTRIAKA